MNTFEISGRIGHLEQSGKTLKIALYTTRVHRGQDGPQFKQERISLVTFGPKAAEIVETYTVGQTLKLGGFIRGSKYGNDLVVTRHEPIVKAEAEAPAAEVASEPKDTVEPVAEDTPVAPKKGRGRKKQAA
jgi:hypothetical protein